MLFFVYDSVQDMKRKMVVECKDERPPAADSMRASIFVVARWYTTNLYQLKGKIAVNRMVLILFARPTSNLTTIYIEHSGRRNR